MLPKVSRHYHERSTSIKPFTDKKQRHRMGRASLGYTDNEGHGWSPNLYCLLSRQTFTLPQHVVEVLASLTFLVHAEHL